MKELKDLIGQAQKEKVFSAIAIEVLKNEKNVLSLYDGTTSFESDDNGKRPSKVTDEHLFDLASLTKSLCTATLCSMLIEKNLLSLDTKISDVYGEYALSFNKELGNITVAQLLNHSSGLESWFPVYKTVTSRSDAYMFVRSRGLHYKTGTKHVYSDLGYIMLGEMLEIIMEKKLDYLFDHITGPLELKDIKFFPVQEHADKQDEKFVCTGYSDIRGRMLIGEVNDENCYTLDGVAGHAGLFGTAKDVTTVAKHIFKTHKLLFQKSNDGSEWAYGWHYPTPQKSSSGTMLSQNSVGITGFTGTSLWIDMDNNIIITILSNRTVSPDSIKFGGDTDKFTILRPKLHDIIMGEILK